MMLDERVLVVTGGGSGIGRAAALAAAKEGAWLAVADRTMGPAEETASAIRAAGGRAIAIAADVSRADDVAAMVERVVAEYGRLDAALNNAGVAQWQIGAERQRLDEISQESWDKLLAVNVTGAWLCMKAEITQMRRQGHGSIVNTASIAGMAGIARSGAYAASKHAVIGLTKSAALENAEAGIRVNCVCPGLIDTQFAKSALAAGGPGLVASIPLRRLGTPDEVAEVVVWLLSDRARYVTGSAYVVDGGATAS